MKNIKKYAKRILGLSSGSDTFPKFATDPRKLNLASPRIIKNPDRIFIGDDVSIGMGSILKAQRENRVRLLEDGEYVEKIQKYDSKIVIGNRVSATSVLHIAAFKEIIIEDDVLIASNVFICDGSHGFENTDIPYRYQNIVNIQPIRIKKGCWLGQNVVIMPGVTIGEFCIIGANSVVTKSVPDKSIAVGSPARVLKRWDENNKKWISVKESVDNTAENTLR
jgi:acetyltransferase-like isoleucine patch superfamily enzyme